jgi:hypothetical protein
MILRGKVPEPMPANLRATLASSYRRAIREKQARLTRLDAERTRLVGEVDLLTDAIEVLEGDGP